MKLYSGRRDAAGNTDVRVDGKPLDPRLDIRNHSPTGFEWGYGGSGPAQLALAICADAVGPERAQRVYQTFKFAIVSHWGQEWTLNETQVIAAVEHIERNQAGVIP